MGKGKEITITLGELKQIIREEAAKLGKMKDVETCKAKEVDADEQADQLEAPKDWMKTLDIKEEKLRKELIQLRRTRRQRLAAESKEKK